ncbi:hypothetical protein LR004_02810 [Candidatus Gracilibacteria bacterium]|nr:hypothetical protein [Candidatus Gracilibacteria bacterium]
MAKFKISVSKEQKKYSIVLSASSENEARKKVHSEGYSILSVKEFNNSSIEGHKFFFVAKDKNGGIKKGQVVAKDPFKVYVKLRDGLKYDVLFLYSEDNKNISEDEKKELIAHLNEQYTLYKSHTNKNKSEKVKKEDIKKEKKNLESFYLKKELEQTYRLLDFILIKIKNILEKAEEEDVNEDKRKKLQKLYNSITSLKKSTNITKLREVGELGLKKIGEIELNILEKYKDDNSKKLLNETNSLLKKIGSKEQFVQKEKTISYKIKSFIGKISEDLSQRNKGKNKEEVSIDKQSSSYWKTELLINKYIQKKRENTIKIFKNLLLFLFPFGQSKDKKDELLIRRKIISQNITILKAKKTGKMVSYTKLVKGYNGFIDGLVKLLQLINSYFIFIIYGFSSLFLVYILGTKIGLINFGLNMSGIFTIIYVIIGSILIFISRGIFTLGFNLALFTFLFIFGVVNF